MTVNARQAPSQTTMSAQIANLQRHSTQVQLRASDLQVQIAQLTRQQATFGPQEAARFDKPLADAQHELTAARLDFDATRDQIAFLRASEQGVATTAQPPSAAPLWGPFQLERAGAGLFLLLLPIMFAFARRIWVRSGATQRPMYDLESSPRLQRLEDAVESIALEVERIGEAQRFAAKLLSERRPDAVIGRASAPAPASVRREPGTITPH